MKQIRAGIVGTTFIAQAHWDALRRMPGVEIVAVCGRNPARTQAFAQRNGIGQWYTDCRQMIDSAQLDVLHNCAATAQHDAINHAAIAAGLHVYAEKPLSDSAAAAKETWRMAEAKGIVHGLNHQYRMNPAVQEMRSRVQDGHAGRVFMLGGHYHQQSGLEATDYRARMNEKGVTWALGDIGTHWLDTAACILGQRVARVCASICTVHTERIGADGLPFTTDADDMSCILVAFEGGAQGAFTVSKVSAGHMNDLVVTVDSQACSMAWAQERPNLLSIGYRGRPNELLQVTPALLSGEAAPLVTLPGGHPMGWSDALLASVRDFYAVVRGEKAQSALRCATFKDGFELMAFVEAALRSSKAGAWTAVEY